MLMTHQVLRLVILCCSVGLLFGQQPPAPAAADGRIDVAAIYFPGYHRDVHYDAWFGEGWNEWKLLMEASPRFHGQHFFKPRWGPFDEADPKWMERQIALAADHGITIFIFDWYWYSGVKILHRPLEEGFLRAGNRERLKYALMWANHDWIDIHPAKRNVSPKLLYPGVVTKKTFETLTDYVVEKYFSHPSYWKIGGCPYFSVYELFKLVAGLGGIQAAREALSAFRQKTKTAGFPDLHLNAITWGVQILPGEQVVKNPNEMLSWLGFDSVTSYVWVHHFQPQTFPTAEYATMAAAAEKYWQQARKEFALPYFPNVTMGWDASPRTTQTDPFENTGYPFMPVIVNNTSAEFKKALQRVRQFLDEQKTGPKIFTINAWNEWTEGSYLEPDTLNRYEYLQAVKDIFSSGTKENHAKPMETRTT